MPDAPRSAPETDATAPTNDEQPTETDDADDSEISTADDVAESSESTARRTASDDGDDPRGSSDGRAVSDDVEGSVEQSANQDLPEDVRRYARFTKMDGAAYDRVNGFLRDRTYITAREWAIARLCADFRTETGVEMTKIGNNLPELVPFMTDTYSPQAVNQARAAFEEKVTNSGATFLYGAMSGFFTAEELDELMYEVTEVAKFLLEVEGADLAANEELDVEDRISEVMRDVRRSSERLRTEETGHDHESCPHCGERLN